MRSRMFPFITHTWNPLGGKCRHECVYCWARKLIEKYHFVKYEDPTRLFEKALRTSFKAGDFVFVCDMCDLFGQWVPDEFICSIRDVTKHFPETNFLFLTKNPRRYSMFQFTSNSFLGCTIETDESAFENVSKAPPFFWRYQWMAKLAPSHPDRLFISIEPILDFNLQTLSEWIIILRPWAVAIGYDNYDNHLPEPSLTKTLELIQLLKNARITIYEKTLRAATQECWA